MDLHIHMKGNHIGELNIYQAPIVGFAVKKLSLSRNQGQHWFKRQVQFDSDTEFQVCNLQVAKKTHLKLSVVTLCSTLILFEIYWTSRC